MADFDYDKWQQNDREWTRRQILDQEQRDLMNRNGGYLTSPRGRMGGKFAVGVVGSMIWLYLLQSGSTKIAMFVQQTFTSPGWHSFMNKWTGLAMLGFTLISFLVVFIAGCLFKLENLVQWFLVTAGVLLATALVTGIVTLLITAFV